MSPPVVSFIGIGAQKCASTWVHRVLDEHPQAFLSTPKELDYFSYFYGRGCDWYEGHFAAANGQRVVGDNSPSYLVHPLAPARAARYNPKLRIVLALRDPVERAFSNHLHMIRAGFLEGGAVTFEHGLSRNEMYVEQSRYAKHLRNWLSHFPAEQLHVVFQEELSTQAASVTRALYRFLGVDEGFQPGIADARANESRLSTRPELEAAFKRGASALRRAGLGPLVSAVTRSRAVQSMRRASEVSLRDLVPPMQEATRARLVDMLQPDMHELARLLGRETLPWGSFVPAQRRELARQ
jgi:hypothetical protein